MEDEGSTSLDKRHETCLFLSWIASLGPSSCLGFSAPHWSITNSSAQTETPQGHDSP